MHLLVRGPVRSRCLRRGRGAVVVDVAKLSAGRERYYRLERERLGEVESWLVRIDRFWERSLGRLGEHLDVHP